MSAYLLAWSPKQTDFEELPLWSEDVRKGHGVEFRWSCGRRQTIKKGDRVFLIRLGQEPKGVFGAGTVTRGSYQDLHWKPEKAKNKEMAWYVYAEYDILLDPESDAIVSRDSLDKPPFFGVHWSTQSSGINIPDTIAVELDRALKNLRRTQGQSPLRDLKIFENTYLNLAKTERETVVQSRVGQGKFRSDLINYWISCAVTGCEVVEVLRASHIKPWRECTNAERLDIFNGLLLIPNLDNAFDSGLISFEDDGKIKISKQLSRADSAVLGIHPKMKLSKVEAGHKKYLDFHRKNIFSFIAK
jgi:hypothetical protein